MSCLTFRSPQPQGVLERFRWLSPIRTPGKVRRLHEMSESDDPRIRACAAGNPMTAEDDLWALSWDEKESVRAWILRNPKVPRWIVRQMKYGDESSSLRFYADYLLTYKFQA